MRKSFWATKETKLENGGKKMASVVTKTGKRKTYKNYELCVGAYSRKGYVKLMHKRTGNTKYVKL